MTITDTITRTISRAADQLDVTRLTHLDLSKLDIRNIDLPAFELPKIELPELPKVDLPVDTERVAAWARDAAYVGIGAVVVAGQQAEQQVRTIATTVSGAVSDAVTTAGETVSARVRTLATTVADAVR